MLIRNSKIYCYYLNYFVSILLVFTSILLWVVVESLLVEDDNLVGVVGCDVLRIGACVVPIEETHRSIEISMKVSTFQLINVVRSLFTIY